MPGGHTLVGPTSSAKSVSYLVADLRSFNDENFQLERRIRELSAEDPYTQTQYDEDQEAQHDLNNRVYCICISDFLRIKPTWYTTSRERRTSICSASA